MNQKVGYSASLVTQGDHRFYQLAMPSDILSQCTFVSTREEDPTQGFQRLLDEKRALEIAKYIDSGLGTVPTSIILSAQAVAEFEYGSKNKTVEFVVNPKSFLILDGQHRVYGFRKASSNIRVPVVIYSDLSRRDESRLFIDINSKQRGVPNELLLDIKNQAEYETNEEELYRIVFDAMNNDPSSPLFSRLSASKRATQKISRVTFNAAMKSIYKTLSAREPEEVIDILSNYLFAVQSGLRSLDGDDGKLAQSIVFRGLVAFFVPVASKVKDRFGSDYSAENFEQITRPVFERIKTSKLSGNSPSKILKYLESNLVGEFSL
jgi:DGQHR domain-containing protein